jgi:hypothetical protein
MKTWHWLRNHFQVDKDFRRFSLAFFAYQFQHNLPYQRFCSARSHTPDTVTRWQDIPAVPTVAFKELDLTCGPPEKIFRTSGTTRGQEKRGRHLVPDLELYHASALAHFSACLLSDNRRLPMLALIPTPEMRPDSSLTQMIEWVKRQEGTPTLSTQRAFTSTPSRTQSLTHNWKERRIAFSRSPQPWWRSSIVETTGQQFTLPGGSHII